MKILVQEVWSEPSGKVMVCFRCDFGGGKAVWAGPCPEEKSTYEVEVEVEDVLYWQDSIFPSSHTMHAIFEKDDHLCIVGEVIALEEGSCLSINVGGSVMLLEVAEVPENINGFVEVRTPTVLLYPVNL